MPAVIWISKVVGTLVVCVVVDAAIKKTLTKVILHRSLAKAL